MNKSPAYQWYPKDILASSRVGEMTAEEECWYRRALDFCWVNGSIPADLERLARLIGKGATENGLKMVANMFTECPTNPTRLVHERQEMERLKQREWREKSAKGGKAGAGKRKEKKQIDGKKGGADVVDTKPQPNKQQNDTLQSPTSSLPSAPISENGNAATAAPIEDPVERRIWRDGIDLLAKSALTEKQARPLLGRLAKDYGNDKLAEAIAVTQAKNSVDPKTFLIGVLQTSKKDQAKLQIGKPQVIEQDFNCNQCFDSGEVMRKPEGAQFDWQLEAAPCDCKLEKAA